MATSPLTTALKPNVSAGDDAEQKYQQALTELMQRLDTRKNRLFDPVLLAMAQGFLTPGQTGTFGEALGNVAQRVGAAEAQRQKEDIDISQLRLQVAQGAREQASKIRGQEAFRGLLGGQRSAAQPAGEGEEGEEFPGATSTGLRTVAGDTGDVVAPRQAAGQPSAGGQRNITERDALAFAAAYPDQKDLAKMLMDAAKFNADRYKVAMNGTVFDTVEGRYITAIPPGQTASGYFIPEARGTVLMTPSQHADYQTARSQGNSRQWLDSFYGGEPGKVEYVTQEMLAAEAERKKQAASEFLIPEVNDYVKMTPGQYEDYLKARRAGEGAKWVESFFGRPVSGGASAPTAGALAARTEAPQDFLIPEVNGYLRMTPSENAKYREAKAQGKGQEWVTNFVGQQGGQAPTTQRLAQQAVQAQETASDYFIPEFRGNLKLTPSQFQEYQKSKREGNVEQWLAGFVTKNQPPPTTQQLSSEAAAAQQTPSEFFIPEIGGKLSMRPAQFEEYQRARARGLANQWLQQNFSAQPAVRPSGAAPGATPGAAPGAVQGAAAPGRIPTAAQIDADAAAKRAEAESVAKADAERYNTAIAKGNDAGSKIASYRSIAATARLPSAKQIFGVFEQGGVSDALLRYMEANNGVLGVKEIRDIWTGLGLDAKAISDKQVAMSLIAQSQFEFSQLAKGQGTISDQERKLFAAMGTDISDRPETVLRKMQMLERRAQFDREVSKMARDARKKGVSFDDMKDTDTYRTAQQAYESDLIKAVTGSGRNVSGARSQAPGAAPGAAPRAAQGSQGRNPAADRIRRDVGIAQ
jgi:hypothetical protein